MKHVRFGHDDEFLGGLAAAIGDHFLGGADLIGRMADLGDAFGVRNDLCRRVLLLRFGDCFGGELGVYIAKAGPEQHFAVGLLHHPGTQILIGSEENGAIRWAGRHDLDRIAAGADDVRERLHLCRAVDVGDDVELGMFFFKFSQLFGGAALFQAAAGAGIGQDDGPLRVQYFGGFGHEVDSAEEDDPCIGFGGLAGEPERIADIVRNALNFCSLIVVGQDERLMFFFKAADFSLELCNPLW